ncbi:MAG: hypothetical protein AVDCRST_MAG50-1725, partial [uncultured Acidimicrobiales bacterium]
WRTGWRSTRPPWRGTTAPSAVGPTSSRVWS